MRLRQSGGFVPTLGLCLLASHASAQVPAGSEFQVNSYTTDGQYRPSVAMATDGTFVVVWESRGSPGNDSSQQSIQGQRYASDGSPQGAQFQVNSYITSFQLSPSVAAAPDGNFAVVWESNGSSGTDDGSTSIQGQRYASNGSAQGSQFQVNTYITGNQAHRRSRRRPSGDFVVAWDSYGSPGTDTSDASIQAQRFASNGSPQGAQFQVNSYTTSYQYVPAVATAPDGDFVVVWESHGLARERHERLQHPGPALRGGRLAPGRAVPGEHLHHERPDRPRRGRRGRRALRRGMAERRLLRHGHGQHQHPGAALCRERDAARRAVPGQHLYHLDAALHRRGRAGQRRFRRRLGERRLERQRHELSEHPRAALHGERHARGQPVPGQHLHHGHPELPGRGNERGAIRRRLG